MKNVVVAVILGVIAVIAGLAIERGVSEACGQLAEMNNNPGTSGYVGDGNRIVTNANGTRTLYLSEGTAYEQVHQLPAAGSNTTPSGVNCNAALPPPAHPSSGAPVVHRDANGDVIDAPGRLGMRTGYIATTRSAPLPVQSPRARSNVRAVTDIQVRHGATDRATYRRLSQMFSGDFDTYTVASSDMDVATVGTTSCRLRNHRGQLTGSSFPCIRVTGLTPDPTTTQDPVRVCQGMQSTTDPGGCTPHPSDTVDDTANKIGDKCSAIDPTDCTPIYAQKPRYPHWPYTDSNEDTLIAGVVYEMLPQEEHEATITVTATNDGTGRSATVTFTVTVFVDPNAKNVDPEEGTYVTPGQ